MNQKLRRKPSKAENAPNDKARKLAETKFMKNYRDKIYRKFEFPASFQKAKMHKKAAKFGYNPPEKQKKTFYDKVINPIIDRIKYGDEKVKLCPCCSLPINTKTINICYNTTDHRGQRKPFFLNSSAAMFFSFIKMAIIYLILVFLIFGVFNLLTSFDGNYCDTHQQLCDNIIFEKISAYNKHNDRSKNQFVIIHNILCLGVVIVSIIFFIIYRKIQYRLNQQFDSEHQTQNDYTIFVENIPLLDFKNNIDPKNLDMVEFDYEAKLKRIFEFEVQSWLKWMKEWQHEQGSAQHEFLKALQQKNISIQEIIKGKKITSVSLCFDISLIEKINTQRQQLMNQQIALHKSKDTIDYAIKQKIQKEISVLNEIQLGLCQKFAGESSAEFNITHFTGKAFVSFEYQHFRDYIMRKYYEEKKQFKYANKVLKLSNASHPTDIYWANMRITDKKRARKVLNSYVIIGMILFFSTASLVLIDYVKIISSKLNDPNLPHTLILNYGLSIFSSLFAVFINIGISSIAKQLTEYQKHQTMTNKLLSMIIKIFVSQFFNTAFIFYMIQVFNKRPYLSSTGLVVQVSFLIVVSGFISIWVNAINIPYWRRYIKLFWNYRYIKYQLISSKQIPTYQNRLNKQYELPVFNIASRYSYYLVQVYTCMFYAYLIPVGVLAVAVIFLIQFWIDKFIMFKSSSQYNQIDYFLTRMVFKIFEGSLLAFAIGNLIFSSQIHGNLNISLINLLSFAIALIYICFMSFAPDSVLKKLVARYEQVQKDSYSECLKKQKFKQTYWLQNPATVFAKQVDINDENSFVDQGTVYEYFDTEDMKDMRNQTIKDYESSKCQEEYQY